MKRLILLFLLAILPLQTSWSAVGVYCQQEEPVCTVDCYYPTDESTAYLVDEPGQAAQTSTAVGQSEHSCNTSPAAFILFSQHTVPPSSTLLALRSHDVQLSLPTHVERLERPKWFSPA